MDLSELEERDDEEYVDDVLDEINRTPKQKERVAVEEIDDRKLVNEALRKRTPYAIKRKALADAHEVLKAKPRAISVHALCKEAAVRAKVSVTTMTTFYNSLGGVEQASLLRKD